MPSLLLDPRIIAAQSKHILLHELKLPKAVRAEWRAELIGYKPDAWTKRYLAERKRQRRRKKRKRKG